MPGSRFRKRNNTDDLPKHQPKVLTRSPPPSPKADKIRPKEPYPIPSNNPSSQYTLLEKLGTGSFGTVYKAMHNETKQIVAIKQIGISIPLFVSILLISIPSR
jgi:serine/threonine-protein kinase 24/25/MST4